MANNIKGIKIEIGGNTEPLDKSLKNVNKTSRDLQGELREVNRQLKLDPNNTTLLEQKQKLLAESVTNTKVKLNALKEAERQAQDQFKQGKISEEQYRALQREVIKTATELKNLESKAEESNTKLGKVSETANKVGKAAGVVAVAGVAAIGTALVGTAVAGVAMSDELTKALNGIEAATGYNKESMSGMEEVMLNIYNNNFGENFEDIGKAIEEVGKQTGETGKDLEDLTTNALMVRDTFGFEITESTRSAKMLMDQFGASGHDAYNLIAQGAQWGLDKNGDLLDTINEYSATFKAQGFSAEEMFGMLQNGAASGAFSVDKLGDAVKEFGIRTKDGSKSSAEGFKALNLDAVEMTKQFNAGGEVAKAAFDKTTKALFEMKDPVAQNAAGVALFGTQWEDLGTKGVEALVDTRSEISLTTDALKGINDVKYNSFGEGIEGIKRQLLTGLAIPLSEELTPKLSEFGGYLKDNIPDIVEKLKPIISSIVNVVKSLIDNLNIIIPILAIVVGGFMAFGVITKIITLITTISGVIATVSGAIAIYTGATVAATGATLVATPAMTALAGAITFITGPIGLTILAVIALVAGFTYLWNHCEGFRNFWIALWEGIKAATKVFVDALVSFFTVVIPGAFNAVLDFVKNNWQAILLFLVNPFAGALAFLYNLNPQFREWIDNVASAIVNGFNSAIDFITSLPGKAIGWGKDFIQGLIDGIEGMIGSVVDAVSSVAEKIWSFLHFTVPEEGPLTDYESWMPDFMGGLAKGIQNSKYLVANAVEGLSTEMSVGMQLSPSMLGIGNTKSESTTGGNIINNTYGSVLHTDSVNIKDGMDIQSIAEELVFYMKQKNLGGGER